MTERWHGTTGGYCTHRCRCAECRAAQARWSAAYRVRRRARGVCVQAETAESALSTLRVEVEGRLLQWASEIEACLPDGVHAGINSTLQEMRVEADRLAALTQEPT